MCPLSKVRHPYIHQSTVGYMSPHSRHPLGNRRCDTASLPRESANSIYPEENSRGKNSKRKTAGVKQHEENSPPRVRGRPLQSCVASAQVLPSPVVPGSIEMQQMSATITSVCQHKMKLFIAFFLKIRSNEHTEIRRLRWEKQHATVKTYE